MRFERVALACILAVCALCARFWHSTQKPQRLPSTPFELALAAMTTPGKRPLDLSALQAGVHGYTGKTVEILPSRELPQGAFKVGRGQWNAEATEPHLVHGPSKFVVTITDADLYTEQVPEWRYCFGARFASTAILSSYRMSEPASATSERLLKMTLRYFLEGAYGLKRTDDPRSLLFRSVMGPEDIDTMQLSH